MGDGLCVDMAPDVFVLLDDGLAYVKDGGRVLSDPGGADAMAPIPPASWISSLMPPRSVPASASSSNQT